MGKFFSVLNKVPNAIFNKDGKIYVFFGNGWVKLLKYQKKLVIQLKKGGITFLGITFQNNNYM